MAVQVKPLPSNTLPDRQYRSGDSPVSLIEETVDVYAFHLYHICVFGIKNTPRGTYSPEGIKKSPLLVKWRYF